MISDEDTNLSQIKQRLKEFVRARDWKKYHNPKDLAISISIESAELLELFQWLKEHEIKQAINNPEKFQEMKDEIADIMIYCLCLSNALKFDVSNAINDKIGKNEKKYPKIEN